METCHVVRTADGKLVMVALAGYQVKKLNRNQPTIRQLLIGTQPKTEVAVPMAVAS